MIYISNCQEPIPGLRSATFFDIQVTHLQEKYGLGMSEERERLYIITTLQCPCRCEFCLFIKTADERPDCSDAVMAARVSQVLRAFPEINFSISITGGEPLMHPARIKVILDTIRQETQRGDVRWIGFGASGTTRVPLYLNDYPFFHFDIYLSRHHYDPARQKAYLVAPRLNSIAAYTSVLNAHVSVRLSCNLLRGGIDSVDEIKKYLIYAQVHGIHEVTFRELNQIADRTRMYTEDYIQDYIKYYEKDVIPLQDILAQIDTDKAFHFLSQDIRPFIYHERWMYDDIAVTFRRVDEKQLLDYNAQIEDIDEIVIHPDGLVTGCWDRDQKVLVFDEH